MVLLGFAWLEMSSHSGIFSGMSYSHGGRQACERGKLKLVIPLTVSAQSWQTVISAHKYTASFPPV